MEATEVLGGCLEEVKSLNVTTQKVVEVLLCQSKYNFILISTKMAMTIAPTLVTLT